MDSGSGDWTDRYDWTVETARVVQTDQAAVMAQAAQAAQTDRYDHCRINVGCAVYPVNAAPVFA